MSKDNGSGPAPENKRRVGAVLSADEEKVMFLGWGVYEGEHVPMEAVGWMAETAREMGHTNPRIRLDNGSVVYGCECWWGDEDRVKSQFMNDKRVIINVDINDVRTQQAKEVGE